MSKVSTNHALQDTNTCLPTVDYARLDEQR